MALPLPVIDNSNTYDTKVDDEAVPVGEDTTHVAALDLNNLKTVISENRTELNTLASAVAGPVSSTNNTLCTFNGSTGKIIKQSTLTESYVTNTLTSLTNSVNGVSSAVHTAATLTLNNAYRGQAQRIDTTSNAIEIQIPDTIDGGLVGSGVVFKMTIIVDTYVNVITFKSGAGFLTPIYYGKNTVDTVNSLVTIYVTRGKAYVSITEEV